MFLAEIKRLDADIARYEARLAAASQRVMATESAAELARAELEAALERILALQEEIAFLTERRQPSRSERLRVEELVSQLQPLARRARSTSDAFSRASAEHGRISHQLANAVGRRQMLLARHRLALDPVILREVKIIVTDPRDRAPRELYRAEWIQEQEEDRIKEVAVQQLADALEQLGELVAELKSHFDEAERRFIATDRRWQQRNADYIVEVAAIEAVTNTFLELADVGVSVWMSGPAWPATLAFEAIYRPAEALIKGNPPSQLPALSEEIIEARQRMAAPGLGALPRFDLPAPANPLGGFGAPLGKALFDQTVKTVGAVPYAGMTERLAQYAFPYFRDAVAAGTSGSWQKLAFTLTGEIDRPDLLYRALGGITRQEGERYAEMLIRAALPGEVDRALNYLAQPKFWTDFAKSAGVGFAVTAAKEGVRQVNRTRAQAIFEDLARIELEWFVRRRALQTVSFILQFHRQVQHGLAASIANVLDELDRDRGSRSLRVLHDGPIVLSDWDWRHKPRLDMHFTGRMLHSMFGFDRPHHPGGGMGRFHPAPLDREAIGITEGPNTLLVQASEPWDLNDGFDSDPRTFARLTPEREWVGREKGPDRSHELTFSSPRISLVAPVPAALEAGMRLEFSLLAPSTIKNGAWIGIVDPVITPEEMPRHLGPVSLDIFAKSERVPVPPVPAFEGRVWLTAPEPGHYEVRLYDREARGVTVARWPLCIPSREGDLRRIDCTTIVGHWLYRRPHSQDDFPREIVHAQGSEPEIYEIYAPTRATASGGPSLTCVRDEEQLLCKAAPGYISGCRLNGAENLTIVEATIDPGGTKITGVQRFYQLHQAGTCTLVDSDEVVELPFEMQLNPELEASGR